MTSVRSGLDRLVAEDFRRLRGKRVGLLTHQPGVDRHLRHALGLFRRSDRVNLVRLFAPEHGFGGEAQDQIQLGRKSLEKDLETVTLYGDRFESLWPDPEHLAGLDVLVADIQDVGSRYYTYYTTLLFCMERAALVGLPILVLDRPNPIGGQAVEGPVLRESMRSFVGYYPLPVRHGLTVGELARLANESFGIGAELEVLPMEGWTGDMGFSDTGLPFVMPSPNMPTEDTAWVYPGGCLLEGTNLSEGRGTTRPFELFGAPWLDAERLAEKLTADELPGVRFRPTRFQPTFHKFAGEICRGLQVHVTDRRSFLPWKTYVAILRHIVSHHPEFDWRRETYEFVSDRLAIDLLFGDPAFRLALEAGASLEEIDGLHAGQRRDFEDLRKRYFLYPRE